MLDATDPVLGQLTQLALRDGPPLAAAAIVLGRSSAPVRVPGSGCYQHLATAGATPLATFTLSASGSWSGTVRVPNDPALVGLRAAVQAALGPTATPLGLDLSNGVVLAFGST